VSYLKLLCFAVLLALFNENSERAQLLISLMLIFCQHEKVYLKEKNINHTTIRNNIVSYWIAGAW